MEGKWNVDVAMLIAEVVFKQIMAIGIKANIQSIKLFIKDQSTNKFHKQFAEFKNIKSKGEPKQPTKDRLKTFVEDIKEELKEKETGLMVKEDK
jgi:isopropylmalate/homocitrate/citramalate synthase